MRGLPGDSESEGNPIMPNISMDFFVNKKELSYYNKTVN